MALSYYTKCPICGVVLESLIRMLEHAAVSHFFNDILVYNKNLMSRLVDRTKIISMSRFVDHYWVDN
jgi:hypothetical protein